MLVFGGTDQDIDYNGVWALDLEASREVWKTLRPTGRAPYFRRHPAAEIDTVNNRLVVFGGYNDDRGVYYDETWILDLSQGDGRWQKLPGTGMLRKRALAERASLVQTNQMLEQRVQEMLTLHQIGKAVASLTDLDAMLARIVEAAVFLLRTEEASIMLRDRKTNELYLRAQKGLGEKQARGFNLKIQDTLIGSVVQTRQPVRLARERLPGER